METKYTNRLNRSLSMAVWLATDGYDYDDRPNYISATSLLKPLRQLILKERLPPSQRTVDVSELVQSRMGNAIHDSIEKAWVTNGTNALKALGYPPRIAERVVINKPPNEVQPDEIPVYLEQRSERELDGFIVAGKFDFVGEGIVEDFKSTSTFKWMKGSSDNDYRLQGSIYRWLNPDIVTADFMRIQFVFTDWNKLEAIKGASRGYPQNRQEERTIELMSAQDTEQWIKRRLAQISHLRTLDQAQLPECTDEELWKTPPTYKYYKKPGQSRATRASDDYQVVYKALLDNNSVGEIKTIPGKVKACSYCDAFPICTQKDKYIASGELIVSSK